jgi:hypothetical protein
MTIYRIRLNFDLYNAPYPPSFAKKGWPQAFTPEQQGVSEMSIDAFWLVFAFAIADATGIHSSISFHYLTNDRV